MLCSSSFTSLSGLIGIGTCILQLAIPVIVAAALLFFFWGLAGFILSSGDTEAQKKGRDRIIWGLVSIFVILSVWGLVGVLQQTFFGSSGTSTSGSTGSSQATGKPMNINPYLPAP